MKQVLSVAKQVFYKNIKSWGFYFMVFGPIIFLLIFGLIGKYFSDQESEEDLDTGLAVIALVSDQEEVNQFFASIDQEDMIADFTSDMDSVEEAQTAFEEDEVDGILQVDMTEDDLSATFYQESGYLNYLVPYVQEVLNQIQVMNRATSLGLSQEEVGQILEPVNISQENLEVPAEEEAEGDVNDFAKLAVAYVINFALFFFIMFYSGMITEEIATEKGSRVMEVILSSMTATKHFFGKLLGVVFTILLHIALYIILGGLVFVFFIDDDLLSMVGEFIDISEVLGEFMGVGLVLGVIALILYSVVSAFLGSLVTKTEDAGKVMIPLVFLALAGFYIGIFGLTGNTETALVRYASYVPFWTPLVMPFRIAMDTVGTTELWLTSIGTVVFTILMTWLAVFFYKTNVLVYSSESMITQLKRSWSINQSNREARKQN